VDPFQESPTVSFRPAEPRHAALPAGEGSTVRAADWPMIPGYEVLSALAPGGMGIVYQARQTELDRIVALKMIRTGVEAGPEERARFRVEAQAVASLSHPNIIQIYDCGESSGMPYLAMEFAEGGSLAQRLQNTMLEPAEAAALVAILARAVQFVHDRDILHRDLKPGNVLLTGHGVPKLADFGLAKRLDQDQGLTRPQAVLGTASYMAPEQARHEAIGPLVDVYALGAILYELLTGRPPFRGETREMTIHQLLFEEPVAPCRLKSDADPLLEAICIKCLEKNPGLRYQSASALALDLERYLRSEPMSIEPLTRRQRHERAARHKGYEILEALGADGPATSYKAKHLALNRMVVLDMIASEEGGSTAALRAEAEDAAGWHHANVVEIYDFGELNGEPFFAREYIEGHSLAVEQAAPLLPAQAASLVETLARAVQHAHLRGVVHGNLKPSKILQAPDGICKITGFHLAAIRRPSSGNGPEPSEDVSALGVILLGLLTGRSLQSSDFSARDVSAELAAASQPVPRELVAICRQCLDRDPKNRYESPAVLAEDLRRFQAGEVLYIDNLDDRHAQDRWARRAGFEIIEVLAESGHCFTYKARQVAVDRVVVLKRISAQYRFVPMAKERFRRDARVLAGIRHPNVVRLYDHGEQNDLCYFAREFVDGQSLAESATKSWPPRQSARLVATLARAVEDLHGHGIVHAALNPENIHLTMKGEPKITSFRRTRFAIPDPGLSLPAPTGWSISFLAPEQLAGGRTPPQRGSDIYALGAILYTLFIGRPPFLGQTVDDTRRRILSEAAVLPRERAALVPEQLELVCLACLAKDPNDRPKNAMALADALAMA
jgi:serine/threonine protein kinase